jgi:hypothetical protein
MREPVHLLCHSPDTRGPQEQAENRGDGGDRRTHQPRNQGDRAHRAGPRILRNRGRETGAPRAPCGHLRARGGLLGPPPLHPPRSFPPGDPGGHGPRSPAPAVLRHTIPARVPRRPVRHGQAGGCGEKPVPHPAGARGPARRRHPLHVPGRLPRGDRGGFPPPPGFVRPRPRWIGWGFSPIPARRTHLHTG